MPGIALAYGMETNLPPVAFTCDSYVFAGWKTNVNAGVVFADGAAVSNLTTVAGDTVTMKFDEENRQIQWDIDSPDGDETTVPGNPAQPKPEPIEQEAPETPEAPEKPKKARKTKAAEEEAPAE